MNIKPKRAYLTYSFAILFYTITSSIAFAQQQTIHWARYDFAPFYILQGPYKNQGTGDLIYQLLQEALSQYQHQNILTNYKRIERTDAQNTTICTGTFKRQRTQKLYYFSELVITLPSHKLHYISGSNEARLIDNMAKIENKKISLESLIAANPNIKIGLLKQRRYGAKIKRIQKLYPEQFSYWTVGNGNKDASEMLLKNRVNFSLEFPSVSYFTSVSQPSTSKISCVALAENQPALKTYIGCTKSPLGEKVLSEINTILRTMRLSKTFLAAENKWLPND